MRLVNILPFALSLSAVPAVVGWGAAGHEIVATIAQMYLDPSALPHICHLLNYTSPDPDKPMCHLAPVASWADRVRMHMRWSSGLHFINALDDHPSQTCQFPGERGWAGKSGENVFGGIKNVTGILEDWMEGFGEDERAGEALKFLIHFVGDMHMPLHLAGRDKGGNGIKVHFDGRLTNLHSVWDGQLIAKAIRTTPQKYLHPLPYPHIEHVLRGAIYDSYIRRIMAEGLLGAWKEDFKSWLQCPKRAPPGSLLQKVMTYWSGGAASNKRVDPGEEFDDEHICPFYWAEPTHELNCEFIWPAAIDETPYNDHSRRSLDSRAHSHHHAHEHDHHAHSHSSVEDEIAQLAEPWELNEDGFYTAGGRPPRHRPSTPPPPPHHRYLELDTPEYAGVVAKRMIIEKLLAQAGIRLAGILNMIFAEE
jgi:hypothetical protein